MTLKVEFICSFEIGDFADVKGSPKVEAELIRCKDCKWFDITSPSGTLQPIGYRCKRVTRLWMQSNDYCSMAERKE